MTQISDADFSYISDLLRKEAAIVLEQGKQYLVETRLGPVVRTEGIVSLAELVVELKKNSAHPLKRKVVEALTTNETSFFRDIEPFDALRANIIPEIVERRKEVKELSIWCAASSTGQEPYTLAMLLRENFGSLPGWKFNIYATDIARSILDRAKEGLYSQLEVNRGLPATYLVKYFQKCGNDWRIKDEIRSMVKFSELNLIQPFTGIPQVDIVMIRNVLIYFDVDTKREIFAKIRKTLRPDGYMFLGAAETTLNIDDKFERISTGRGSCYRVKG